MYKDLESRDLAGISKVFGSMNGYIPDCTNIGTTFVNSIANMLTCAAIDVKLKLPVALNGFITEQYIGIF